MNLLESFNVLKPSEYKYYNGAPDFSFSEFSHEAAYNFIRGNYTVGAKDKVLMFGFSEEFEKNGKHKHTVALYFLGCICRTLIEHPLKSYIGKYIEDISWYDFLYTWYLTCLYHDTARVIEEDKRNEVRYTSLKHYLRRHNVEYNLFKHDWGNVEDKPHTYSENLVSKYFSFRIKESGKVDHGILAGYLLYDKLVKNYNDAWNEYSKQWPDAHKDNFTHNGLSWRREHISHFAIVADAIIAHNIWHSEDEISDKKYAKYDLGKLSTQRSKKINKYSNSLLFFLGLLDTIVPVKQNDSSSVDNLKDIEISLVEDELSVRVLQNESMHVSWLNGLASKFGWLDVCAKRVLPDTVKIRC